MNVMVQCRHFMLDIETTSLHAHAGIWQIAMAEFDPVDGDLVGPVFDFRPPWQEQRNRAVDQDTVKWTKEHGDAASFEEWNFVGNFEHNAEATFMKLNNKFANIGAPYMIWCKGAKFDFAILQDYYHEVAGLKTPWHYRNEMCLRTAARCYEMVTRAPFEFNRGNHNAATDISCQAKDAAKIMRVFADTLSL